MSTGIDNGRAPTIFSTVTQLRIEVIIIEILFRVACADKQLDEQELETIRQLSGLLGLAHKEFIDAKVKIKKEFGLATVEF